MTVEDVMYGSISNASADQYCLLQVLIVGDLNIAATQQDVYDKLNREKMYPEHEKDLFDSLLTEFTDVWRKLHPDTVNAFTVWDEKTSARAFNEVCFSGQGVVLRVTMSINYCMLHVTWHQVCLRASFCTLPCIHSFI